MTSFRPKRSQQRDRNHAIVSKVILRRCGGGRKDEYGVFHANLRGLRVAAYDMSGPGGEMIDWLVLVSWFPIFFEVKAEREVIDAARQTITEDERLRGMLKPGEVEFLQTCPAVSMIVTTEDQVWALIEKAADFIHYVDEGPSQKHSSFLRLFFPKLGPDFLAQLPTPLEQE
jgi:hypothetical protein